MLGSAEARVIVPGAGGVIATSVRKLVSLPNETQFVPFVELKRSPPEYRLSVSAIGKGEPVWLALKTTIENTSPARRERFRELKSKVVNSAGIGAIDEFAKVLDPKIVEFGAPEVTPLICTVTSPKVKPSNFLMAKSTEARIPDLPAVITCAANSDLLIAVPAVTTPTLDWSKNEAAQGVGGVVTGGTGNTVGSKVMVVGARSLLAFAIAALKLPAPESAVVVTTIAQDNPNSIETP